MEEWRTGEELDVTNVGEVGAAWVESEPRTPAAIVEVYIQAGRGLAAAHAKELVHRDFKPEKSSPPHGHLRGR